MDKQNVVYTNNDILFSLKKKGNSAYATTWVNFDDTMLNEINQLQKKILCDSIYLEQSKSQTEGRKVGAAGGENEERVSILQD